MSQTASEEFVGNFLEHFGVKGMKWGLRKDKGKRAVSNERVAKEGDSEDFVRTADIAVRVKTSGLRSLSNKELRDLVDRINLEQNFQRINTPEAKKKSPISVGVNYVGKKISKTADMTVDALLKTSTQILVQEEVKKKLAASKAKPNPQLKLFDYS